jgi:hypothetical protein
VAQRVANGRVHVTQRLERLLRVDATRARRQVDLDELVPSEEHARRAVFVESDDGRMIHGVFGVDSMAEAGGWSPARSVEPV